MPSSYAAASALWKSSSAPVERWEQLLSRHAELQRTAGVASGDPAKLARLSRLDADFVRRDLPAKLLRARQGRTKEPPLTKDDLVLMVEWKLLRGKWRPALLGYAKAQTDAAVGAAAAAALSVLGSNPTRPPTPSQAAAALNALCALRGVGPATASIFLCAATGGHVPYMSDEALEACVGSRKYTADEAAALARQLGLKAAALTEQAGGGATSSGKGGGGGGGRVWTAEDVQRALHAAELEARASSAAGGAGAGEGAGAKKKKTAAATTKEPPAQQQQQPQQKRRRRR